MKMVLIISRYSLVRFPLKASSRDGIGLVQLSTTAPQFNYDEVGDHFIYILLLLPLIFLESMSPASSANDLEDEIPRVGPSHIISQLLDAPLVTSPPEAPAQDNHATVVSRHGHSICKQWLHRMGNLGSASHKQNQCPGKSREPADCRSPSHPPTRVDDKHEGPSWMVAGRPKIVSAVPW